MATTVAGPGQRLIDWLAAEHVDYELHEHAPAYTARQVARSEGVDPRTFAKVVGVKTDDGRRALLILDATDHVDLHKARRMLGAHHVRLLTEDELDELAPGYETGALPAVGILFSVPMFADYAVREDAQISFNAGTHRLSVRVDRPAWERASGVVYADLAANINYRPAWSRS